MVKNTSRTMSLDKLWEGYNIALLENSKNKSFMLDLCPWKHFTW